MADPISYALKFISGKYQGGQFPLRANREIVIGRAPDLDMVLAEDMVSRRHARLVTSDSNVVIEDLGSTNGTFVNGEKVRRARLREGDRLLVGTSILKLVSRPPGADDLDEAAAREAMARGGQRPAAAEMAGRLEEVPVPDLLQLCQTSKRTGVLVIRGDGEGRIHLDAGRVTWAGIAEQPDLEPRKAFDRLVGWSRGGFELTPPEASPPPPAFEDSTEALLMDALRRLDELRRLEDELPPGDTPLALARPLGAPLSALSPEALDVLQLAHDRGTVQAVLDDPARPDGDLARQLTDLLRRGYLAAQ